MHNFDRLVTRISTVMAMIAAVLLLTATIVLTWMVAARSLGLHGTWELELAIELMIAAIFLASPYTLATGGHVKMDLLGAMLGPKPRAVVRLAAELAGILVCFYLGYKGLGIAYESFITQERGMGLWQPLLWPRYATVPIGMFMTCVQYLVYMRAERQTLTTPKAREQQT